MVLGFIGGALASALVVFIPGCPNGVREVVLAPLTLFWTTFGVETPGKR